MDAISRRIIICMLFACLLSASTAKIRSKRAIGDITKIIKCEETAFSDSGLTKEDGDQAKKVLPAYIKQINLNNGNVPTDEQINKIVEEIYSDPATQEKAKKFIFDAKTCIETETGKSIAELVKQYSILINAWLALQKQ